MKKLRLLPLLLITLLSGCTITKIPTPHGAAWSFRVMDWTRFNSLGLLYENGTNSALIELGKYEGRVDSDAIEATGSAVGNVAGAAAHKAVTGQ